MRFSRFNRCSETQNVARSADNSGDVDQVHLASVAAARRVDHHFFAVGAESWVGIAAPFACVFRRRMKMTQGHAASGRRLVQKRVLVPLLRSKRCAQHMPTMSSKLCSIKPKQPPAAGKLSTDVDWHFASPYTVQSLNFSRLISPPSSSLRVQFDYALRIHRFPLHPRKDGHGCIRSLRKICL